MSSLASYASPFGNEEEDVPMKKHNAIQQKRQRNNKTMKRRDNQCNAINPKLEAMMNAIKKSTMIEGMNSPPAGTDEWLHHDEVDNDDEDDSTDGKHMGNFKPLSPPHSASAERLHNGKDESSSHPLLPNAILSLIHI